MEERHGAGTAVEARELPYLNGTSLSTISNGTSLVAVMGESIDTEMRPSCDT